MLCRHFWFCLPRSPYLGILSGATAGILLIGTAVRIMLFPDQLARTRKGSVSAVVLQLLGLTCFTGAYGLRGLRLVILYDANVRERWGKLAKDRDMAKTLVAVFVVIEIVLWGASLVVGVDR